jgi:glycosyltransferase involved in cell wall biosynthesis
MSSHRAENEMKSYGIMDDRMSWIPTAIDTSSTVPPKKNDGKDVGCIGRVGKVKNQFTIVEAVSAIREIDNTTEPLLRIAGKANGEIVRNMEAIITQMAPNFGLEYTGFVDEPMKDFYPELAVHCHPSWTENCPQTVLEAAVAGVPTITSNLSWSDAYPYFKSIECNPDDPMEWAEEIRSMLNNREYRNSIARKQQEAVVDNYSAQQISEQYEDLFESLKDDLSCFKIPMEVRA